MTAGNLYAGEQITADDIQGVAPLAVVKSADQASTASSTALANDSELTLPLAASAAYRVVFTPVFTAVAGSDMQITFNLPSGAAFSYSLVHQGGSGTLYLDTGSAARLNFRYYGGGAAAMGAILLGTILTSAAGDFHVQFGQFAANATPAVMKAGSELDMWKIG